MPGLKADDNVVFHASLSKINPAVIIDSIHQALVKGIKLLHTFGCVTESK